MKSTCGAIILGLLFTAESVGHAQAIVGITTQPATPPDAMRSNSPTVYRLTVHSKLVGTPALKYELLPDVSDQTPGNAATAWLLTMEHIDSMPASTFEPPASKESVGTEDRITNYLQLSPELFQARKEEVAGWLNGFSATFMSADAAARRDRCDWDLPLREEGYELLLPHLQPARRVASLLALRARLQIANGEWDAAAHSLQTGFALARDLNRQGLIIQDLVGAAIAARLLLVVQQWQQQPDSPNLFWALAALPRPYVDFRSAMELERSSFLMTFPELRKVRSGNLSEQDWREFQNRLSRYINESGVGAESRLSSLALAIYLYPKARKYMIDQGVAPAEVEAMPVPSLLMRYEYDDYQRWSDEMLKWADLPFWQAWDGMVRSEEQFREVGVPRNPLLMLMPATKHAYMSGARLDRQVAALGTIEALRNYAAAHKGKLPDSLRALTDTPAPLDPFFGKDFDYRLTATADGNARVTIDCPAPAGANPTDASVYEITFSSK